MPEQWDWTEKNDVVGALSAIDGRGTAARGMNAMAYPVEGQERWRAG